MAVWLLGLAKVAWCAAGGVYKGVVKGAGTPEADLRRDRDDAQIGLAEQAYRLGDAQVVQVFAVVFPGMELEVAAEVVGMDIKNSRKVFPRDVLWKNFLSGILWRRRFLTQCRR